MALPVTFATLAAGNQPLSLFDTQFAAVAALGYIPCAASAGPNNIALTPFSNTPVVTSYPDLTPGFIFAAAATSTGAVTLNVSGVGARNAYKWNGAQALGSPPAVGVNDLVAGGIYKAVPLQALNGGAGGFVVDAYGAGNNVTDIEFVIDGGGVAITTGVKGFIRVPWNGTILQWGLAADQSGSIQIDILRANNAIPAASIVGGGTKPNLTAAQFQGDTAPVGWTSTALLTNDWIGFNVTSVATVTRVTIDLAIVKT
jgi:hypothetical protein